MQPVAVTIHPPGGQVAVLRPVCISVSDPTDSPVSILPMSNLLLIPVKRYSSTSVQLHNHEGRNSLHSSFSGYPCGVPSWRVSGGSVPSSSGGCRLVSLPGTAESENAAPLRHHHDIVPHAHSLAPRPGRR